MARSSCIDLTAAEQRLLLAIARSSISAGVRGEAGSEQDPPGMTAALQEKRAAFVTLTRRARLRGCIGTLTPNGPLARAVADSALSAALRDPRFPQLRLAELAQTTIEVSVLTPMEPVAAACREALMGQLQAGIDGLLLEEGRHRSTFLPKVWEQLPDPADFLDQLLAKAGLPAGYWSPSLRICRYQTLTFNDSAQRLS